MNILPENYDSSFKGDNLLFEFLSNNFKKLFRFNMQLTFKTIKPNIMYNLPIGYQKVIDGDCSGIYCFVQKETNKCAIGSAISIRNRLNDHMNSFNGNRLKSYLHNSVLNNGGVASLKWAPLITYDNIIQEWYSTNHAFPLSQGATKILQGFAQYVSRILEQSMYTKYKPYFNIKDEKKIRDIIFFNFALEANELLLSLDQSRLYQAFSNKEATAILAESNSYNSLADQLNVSVGTVINNMNWYKGMNITNNKGENLTIYLKEKGLPFRLEKINSQFKPKDKYCLLKLKDKSLYDLTPGKIFALRIETLEIFGIYKNQRELWLNLNPNSGAADLEKLSSKQQRNFLDNRIGRYFNLVKPGGISTDLGNFYFCKHPDYLPGLTKKASGFFAVNTFTGSAKYFLKNTQAGDRGTVRRNRNNNTITKDGIKYINKDIFLDHYRQAVAKQGATFQLNQEQLANLPDNPKS